MTFNEALAASIGTDRQNKDSHEALGKIHGTYTEKPPAIAPGSPPPATVSPFAFVRSAR